MAQCCFVFSNLSPAVPTSPLPPLPSPPTHHSPALAPERAKRAQTIPAPTTKSDGPPMRAMLSRLCRVGVRVCVVVSGGGGDTASVGAADDDFDEVPRVEMPCSVRLPHS